jgi:anti-sigma regulatory factor (Ser/Thr protein kinase)
MARSFIRSALNDWGLVPMEEDACLLATELVTNGLVHGGGPLSIAVSLHDDRLHIAVGDSQPRRTPHRQHRGWSAEGGRGLALVEAISETWGVSPTRWHRGKVVWCALAVDPTAAVTGPQLG